MGGFLGIYVGIVILTDYETRAVKFESYKFSQVGAISQKKYESSLHLNKIKQTTAKDYALEGNISISHKSEARTFPQSCAARSTSW